MTKADAQNMFGTIAKLAEMGNPEAAGDYRGDDGLLRCGKCHTPKECRVTLFDDEMVVRCSCRCKQEADEKAREEKETQERMERLKRLRTWEIQEPALKHWTFSADNGKNPQMTKAETYVARWEDMKEKQTGLLLWGDVGTGKTFFAGCIANALLSRNVPVLMTNFAKLLNALTGMYSDDKNRYIAELDRYDLLIIDDLGIERSSEYALENVYNIIDSRVKSKKPLIVTTNLTMKDMTDCDMARRRIYDRVLERCVPLQFQGVNFRQLKAAENMSWAKELFS